MQEYLINDLPYTSSALSKLDNVVAVLEKNYQAFTKEQDLKVAVIKDDLKKELNHEFNKELALSHQDNQNLKKTLKDISAKLDNVISRFEELTGD